MNVSVYLTFTPTFAITMLMTSSATSVPRNTYAPKPTEPLKTSGKNFARSFEKKLKQTIETVASTIMMLLRVMLRGLPCFEHPIVSIMRLTRMSTAESRIVTSDMK